jgi:hypothetical protein
MSLSPPAQCDEGTLFLQPDLQILDRGLVSELGSRCRGEQAVHIDLKAWKASAVV